MLEVPRFRSGLMATALFIFYWLFRPEDAQQHWLFIAAILVIGAPVTYWLTRPEIAVEPAPDLVDPTPHT